MKAGSQVDRHAQIRAASAPGHPTSGAQILMFRRCSDLTRRYSSGRFKFATLNLCYERIAESRHDNMDGYMSFDRPRRADPRQAAEAIFKPASPKPLAPPLNKPSIPGTKELVSLRIDRDILDHFQEGGPGWQDRINSALRKFVAK
jgi:uncharacterized protein (DUF4415 family)